MFRAALADECGELVLRINSHDATHSIFEIGNVELWDEHVVTQESRLVQSLTIDSVLENERIDHIDILHLDLQGAELLALIGAKNALTENKIKIIRTEVEFDNLYKNQPLFWEIGSYLSGFNYRFVKNVDLKFRTGDIPKLVWADSIFLNDER